MTCYAGQQAGNQSDVLQGSFMLLFPLIACRSVYSFKESPYKGKKDIVHSCRYLLLALQILETVRVPGLKQRTNSEREKSTTTRAPTIFIEI